LTTALTKTRKTAKRIPVTLTIASHRRGRCRKKEMLGRLAPAEAPMLGSSQVTAWNKLQVGKL